MPSYLPKFQPETSFDLLAIKDIIHKKDKGWAVLRGLLPFLKCQFGSYAFCFSNLNHFSRLRRNSSDAELLYSLYDRRRKGFSYIRESREKGRQVLGCCPYCGLPGNITLDHYLPRDVKLFPQYAVFKENLVPACFDCQSKKSNFFPRVNAKTRLASNRMHKQLASIPQSVVSLGGNVKKFMIKTTKMRKRVRQINFYQIRNRIIHPYYDTFLSRPVLFFAINQEGRGANKLEVRNCNVREKSLLKFHLGVIDLERRAEGPIEHFKTAILKHFRRSGIDNYESALVTLNGLLEDAIARGGAKNYLEAVTIRSLSGNTSELNQIIELSQEKHHRLRRVSLGRRTKS